MPVMQEIHYPKDHVEGKDIAVKYRKEGAVLVSLEKAKNKKEAKRIKDFLLGCTYALEGFAFQYKKTLLFSFLKGSELNDDANLRGWVW